MRALSSSKVYIPVIALITCLIVRWIFIVGYGDFGTDYDYVSRLIQGQWQGRDFFAVFPPLSGYSLLLFSEIFGQQYITTNIHLWFWWTTNSVTAAAIMRAYGGTKEMTALVAVTVALLTVPPNMHGVSFAYIASTLCGLSVLCLLAYVRAGNAATAIAAGLFGGIAILAKPNVGMALLGAISFACLGVAVAQHHERKKYLKCGVLFLTGALGGALLAIAIPGWYGGYGELAHAVLLGGSEIKGGGVSLLLRTVPRISLTLEPPFRWVAELCLTVPLLGLLAVAFVRLSRHKDRTSINRTSATARFAIAYLWALFLAVLALSVWSLWPREFPWRLVTLFDDLGFTSLPFFLWQLLYLTIFVALTVAIIDGIDREEYLGSIRAPFWASVICLIWVLGIVASGRHNTVFAATLFVPVIVLQYARGREKNFYRITVGFIAVWTLAWHMAPNWKSTFARLTPLPAESKFVWLYWPEGGAQTPGSYPVWSSSETIVELSKNVSSRVENNRVLWLVPGPGAAFGGDVYRYGVHGLSANNVPLWGEVKFGNSVRHDPPEYIVSSDLSEWNGQKWSFMHPEIIGPWINENYDLVWKLSNKAAPIYLWEKKSTNKANQ